MAPELMNDVRVLIAPMPVGDREREQLDRWEVREPNEVIVYRVPIERLANIPLSDARQQARYREYVEHTVMLAVNDLLRGGLDDILHHGH